MTGKTRQIGILIAMLATVLLSGCGPQEPAKNPRFELKKPAANTVRRVTLAGPEALPGIVIAELATEQSAVHFARNGTKGMLVARAGGKWAAGPVRVNGRGEDALGEDPQLTEIAPAPEVRGPVALDAHGSGFLLVWASPVAAGHELWAAVLDAQGGLVGEPRNAGRTFEQVSWIEIQSSGAHPTTVLWEAKEGAKQTVFGANVPKADTLPGKLHAPVALTRSAVGWRAATGPAGTVLAWVDGEPGRVHVLALDDRGRPSSPVAVSAGSSALADVEVTALADRFLVGWTDTGQGDHHVHVAHVDGKGQLLGAAKPVLNPVGSQALVRLIASGDRKSALLAWEEDFGVARDPRRIKLSLLDAKGSATGTRSVLDFHASVGVPHIVSDGAGFTALTLAPMQQRGEDTSVEPLIGPVFVRFGAQLAVRGAEPIRVAELKHQGVAMEGVPELTQGLHCARNVCSLLAKGSGTPAFMALVSLPARPSPWRVPARREPVAKPPFVAGLSTLADVSEPVADVSVARLADGRTLVAWVSHAIGYAETADGLAPATATLAYRFIEGGKPGPVHVLSKRAISVGGVALLALAKDQGGAVALIGWAGPANGSQVYGSLIAADGSKLRQKTITKIVRRKNKSAPNEVYDIDVNHDGHGNFLFAWSDSRDGNPEIYVARVNPQLSKNKQDTRLTQSSGPSIEPQLLVTPSRVLVAFSDAELTAPADVFVTELDGKNLAPKGTPQRIESSPAHSRTPRWVGKVGALGLSWIDEESGDTPSALRLVAMDGQGTPTTAARRIRAASGGLVTSRWVSCSASTCQGVLGASRGGVLELAPFNAPRESGAPVAAAVSNSLAGGSKQDAMMSSPDDDGSVGAVFFVHEGNGSIRIRRFTMQW